MIRLCFVCLGNICRSPTAEAVMKHLVSEAGLDPHVVTDSAGTSAYHVGEPPDRRATLAARARGVRMTGAARQFVVEDFVRFDYILAMDRDNYRDICSLARDDAQRAKVRLMRSFDAASPASSDVPDPYYGGSAGFETVLEVCDAACRGLLEHLRREHGL